jgi:hypothetical protein
LYLPPDQQNIALHTWLGEHEKKANVYSKTARAIESYLAEIAGAKPSLQELATRITAELARPWPQSAYAP